MTQAETSMARSDVRPFSVDVPEEELRAAFRSLR